MKHVCRQFICIAVLIGLVCPGVFAQEFSSGEISEDGLTPEALQQMPVTSVPQPNGDIFLQRSRNEVEQIIGLAAGQDGMLDETEQLWVGYLEQPHPSVSVMRRYFDDAAQEFGVPTELLQAIGQVESNWTQMGPSIDQGWGVMHLVQNVYVDTLSAAANLLGVAPQTLKDDARQNIRGAAALLAQYAGEERAQFDSLEAWFPAAKRFSALDGDELQTMQAERYFEVLREGIQKPTLWNEQINLYAHPNVSLHIPETTGKEPVGSADYGPAKSSLYSDCTYTPGRSHKLDTWVNHWIGYGTYAGAISYLRRCDIKASAHFVIKQNGEITQTVRVRDTAWHAGARGYPNNPRSIGIEHEAVITDPSSWNHPAMLKASADMARYFANKYGIPKKRALPGIRGHNEMPGTSTACPGNLPWTTWMNYLNGTPPAAPRLTSGLHVFTNNPSSQPIEYGQWMEASFTVKNYGGKSITFTHIGVGGRAPSSNGGNPDNSNVYDLGFERNITLRANEQRTFTFRVNSFGKNGVWGKYNFWACYRLSDGSWHSIPTGASGTRASYEFHVVKHASAVSLANGISRAEYVPRKGYDHFYVDIPANTTSLKITTTGARSGNYLNLYEKAGTNYPTTSSYDHRAIGGSSNETLTITNPAPGRHTIFVDGYYSSGSERGTPYTVTATWYNPTTVTKKSLTLVSNPGTPIKELNRGAVAAWVSPYWNSSLVSSSVKWIWSSYYTTESENRYGATRTFQESFTIPTGARNIKGRIDISADDRFKLLLNGSQFAENGDHRYIRTYSFTPRVGSNLLEIAGINAAGSLEPNRNAAGVIYNATVTYDLAHTLTVSKTGNGSGIVKSVGISCGSDCSEEYGDGASVTVVATPAAGSVFAGWSGACSGSETCTVTMDRAKTVIAEFMTNQHTIASGAGPGGNISPEGAAQVNHGASQTFSMTPDSGYQIATVLVDGKVVDAASSYTFSNVTADHTIKVYFKKATHSIQASAGTGGAISPVGNVSVTDGANQSFTITPEAGYRIADVLVDGSSVGNVSAYTFQQVSADHRITATFELIPVDPLILTIDDSQAKPGEANAPVRIALDNSKTTAASLQFRILYDAGKGIHAVGGNAGYTLTDRTQGYTASVTVSDDGATGEALVVLYNFSGGEISAGTGTILELLFQVDASATPGAAANLKFTEAVVSDPAGLAIPSDSKDTAIFTIEQPYELGDINADGAVNVLDLQLLINCVLNGGTCPRGDMNGDGVFNVLDVQLLINKINGVTSTAAASGSEPSLTSGDITMVTLPEIQLQPAASGVIGIGLMNDLPVAAGQLTLMYDADSGVDISGVTLTDRAAGFFEPVGFAKDARDPANVKVTVLFYALNGSVIEPGVGDILELSYETTPDASGDMACALSEVLLTTADGASYPAEIDSGDVRIEDLSLHIITAAAESGGSISPNGNIRVRPGADQMFVITPEAGYHIEDVLVDGVSEGAISSYTFEQVNADHLIEAKFAPDAGQSSSYFGFEEFGGAWQDTDKSLTNPDDDWLCWAAAASNILDWTGWNVFDSVQDAFYTFQKYWTNAGGLMEYGWQWWFDGAEPPDQQGWAQLNEGWAEAENGGSFWTDYNFFDYFYEDWAWDSVSGQWGDGTGLMAAIDQYLHSGYGATLAVYSDSGGHALSVWGYEYDEYGNYTGVYVTDSDDYMTDLKLLSVSLVDNRWYLDLNNDYGYQDWFIGGVQALDRRSPVPEPGTLMLIALGLLNLMVLIRKNAQNKRPS